MTTVKIPNCLHGTPGKLLALTSFALAAFSPAALGQTDTYLITATEANYTSDGTNSWNALGEVELGVDNTVTSLVDTSGSSAAGLDFTVTGPSGGGAANISANGNPSTDFPSLSWFSDVDAQTDYYVVDGSFFDTPPGVGQWTISGFNASDVIDVQWIANHHKTNLQRILDAKINGAFSNVIAGNAVSSDNFATMSGKTDYMEWSGLTPDGSGNLVIEFEPGTGNNSFFAALTAMEISVVPEPNSFGLIAGLLASVALLRRRRS